MFISRRMKPADFDDLYFCCGTTIIITVILATDVAKPLKDQT